MPTRFFLRYDKYLVRAVDNMYTNLAKVRVSSEPASYPSVHSEHTPYLIEAAMTGCESLQWLLNDPTEFNEDVKRIYAPSFLPPNFPSQRARLDDFLDDFESFLHLEKEILIRAGMSLASAESLINQCRGIHERQGDPVLITNGVQTLRNEACRVATELREQFQTQQQQQQTEQQRQEQKHQAYRTLRKVATGAGGILIVGLNFSMLATTVGLSVAGTILSGELGVGLVVAALAP